MNTYDTCVANMMMNGNQMTIPWHVNNPNISQVEKKEVPNIIELMKEIYGSHMKESQGKKHYCLIMELYLLVYWRSG